MALSDAEKERLIYLTQQMQKEKGVSLKMEELLYDINRYREAQQEILKIAKESNDAPAVVEEANKSFDKLQRIIDDLTEYIEVLEPVGLIQY